MGAKHGGRVVWSCGAEADRRVVVEGRSCRGKIKRPPARVLAGMQRAALDALLCYLSLHLPAASAGWVHRRRSINSH